MKRKNLWRLLAVTMAAATLSGFTVMSVSAANTVYDAGDNWVGSDYVDAEHPGSAITTKQTITVTNVRDDAAGLSVVAYQLIKGTYKNGKLTGYTLCDDANTAIADMEHPTATEITTIANAVRADTTTLKGITMTKGTGANANQYTASLEAGLYLVLVTGANGYVYNPAVVAVNITNANAIDTSATGGTVDLLEYWAYPANAYLKSSTTSFNKGILGSQASPFVAAENSEGDITSKGAIVSFQLDGMMIPSYSNEYALPDPQDDTENGVIYKIQDKLDSTAFAGIKTLTVKTNTGETYDHDDDPSTPDILQETDVPAASYTITYKNAAGNTITGDDIGKSAVSYELQFADTWLRANAGKNLVIKYDSVLTQDANVNGTANKTTAALSYTVDPSDNNTVEVLRDSTYTYTFEIGGQIDASANGTTTGSVDGKKSFHGYEINKVTEALAATANYTANAETGEYASTHALSGATFTLYDDADFTTIHQMKSLNTETGDIVSSDATCVTGDNGHLVFSGLDVGTYYLKETAAPATYTLNGNEYKVVIAGTIADGTGAAEEGTLTGYSITVSVKDGANWSQIGSSVYAITPAVTKPADDATVMNFDTVVNTITTTVTPAEIINTLIASLPATGGIGTIIITVMSAVGMTVFLTVFLVNRKKKKETEDE